MRLANLDWSRRGGLIHSRSARVREVAVRARRAGEWKLPLVKFDTSAVYDKYIGETEKRIRKVFQVCRGTCSVRALD